jgi:hypothetical protein
MIKMLFAHALYRRSALTAYCLLASSLLSSCFHKDVLSDPADDVSQSFIYSGKSGDLIITQELIFQAQSKSSGGGITRISGYNESRLTAYDLATGAIVGRVELGEAISEGCKIIAVQNDMVWCYSCDAELGLHARDPKSLEVTKKEADYSALAALQLSRPEWMNISDYYGFDVKAGKLMLTDMQGVHYYFDPAANKAEQTDNEMPEDDWTPDYLNSSAYFAEDSFASFDGKDDRQKLVWRYEDSTAQLPFLKPSFFIDLNKERAWKREQNNIAVATAKRDAIKARQDSVFAAHPIFKESYQPWDKMTSEERNMRSDVSRLASELSEAERDLEDLTDVFEDNNTYALNDKPYSTLIYSARTVSDTSRAVLTCVDCKAKQFTERWHLDLSSFYFDPDKAEGAGVFDEGNPDFDYRWADIHEGKFVMIAQLQMICVDMTSGKKLWQITL